jgi:hypothetical protein
MVTPSWHWARMGETSWARELSRSSGWSRRWRGRRWRRGRRWGPGAGAAGEGEFLEHLAGERVEFAAGLGVDLAAEGPEGVALEHELVVVVGMLPEQAAVGGRRRREVRLIVGPER